MNSFVFRHVFGVVNDGAKNKEKDKKISYITLDLLLNRSLKYSMENTVYGNTKDLFVMVDIDGRFVIITPVDTSGLFSNSVFHCERLLRYYEQFINRYRF